MLKAYIDNNSNEPLEVILPNGPGIVINDKLIPFEFSSPGKGEILVRNGIKHYNVEILDYDINGKFFSLRVNGVPKQVRFMDKLDQVLDKMGIATGSNGNEKDIKAPMPGLILEVACTPGQAIKKDEKLLVLEAMKMENVIKAPSNGTVQDIKVQVGDNVEKNQSMILIE